MTKTVFKVEGMMCGNCEAHVNEAVKAAVKTKSVSSSRTDGETVVLSSSPFDPEIVKAAIEKAGYKVKSYEVSEEEKKGFFSKSK